MTVRIIKIESNKGIWYEVQIRFLYIFWLDADIFNPGFQNIYHSLDEAMENINKLKKTKIKKSIQYVIKF